MICPSPARADRALLDFRSRAGLSAGQSDSAILHMAAAAIDRRARGGDLVLADVGCGRGDLYPLLSRRCRRYVGIDALRYEQLPDGIEFLAADLNKPATGRLAELQADVVVSVETIEHLENPRAYMRLLHGLARPGGWIVVTTPNQLSLLSLATLGVKGRFSQFQDVHYPAHLTALLEVDLLRMADELRLSDVGIEYSHSGRLVFTSLRYPTVLSRWFPRALSDNVLIAGRRRS